MATANRELIITNALTGEELECIPIVEEMTALEWSPRGNQVALLSEQSYGKNLLVFNLTTEQVDRKFSGPIKSFAWHWDGYIERLAIGKNCKPIEIWDMESEEKIQDIALEDKLTSLTFEPESLPLAWNSEGTQLVTLRSSSSYGSMDKDVIVWQQNRQRPFRELVGHTSRIQAVAWDKKGNYLATSSGSYHDADFVIKVWDITIGKNIHDFRGHRAKINSLVWNDQGHKLASGSKDATVRIWNLVTGECSYVLSFSGIGGVQHVFWNKNTVGSLLTVMCSGLMIACYQWDEKQNKPYLLWLNTSMPLFRLYGANMKEAILTAEMAHYLSYKPVVGVDISVDSLMSAAERHFYLGEEKHPADEDYILGVSYLRGYGTMINAHKAYKHFLLAVAKSHPRAHYYLGWAYKHWSVFYRTYKISHGKESAETLFKRSFHFYYDQFLANATIEQAITQLDAWLCFTLGSLHLIQISDYKGKPFHSSYWQNMQQRSQKFYQAAIPLLKRASEEKVLQAQFLLGLCYQWGMGTEEDSKEAVRYYQLAATSGYASAQSSLAACYERGIGVTKNGEQALFWYDRAAAQNERWAQKKMSVLRPNPLEKKTNAFNKSLSENDGRAGESI